MGEEAQRKNTVFGPCYEDGSGERFIVTYETNHKDCRGIHQGPRLTVEQFSDSYVFIEGPYIQQFLDAIKKAMS